MDFLGPARRGLDERGAATQGNRDLHPALARRVRRISLCARRIALRPLRGDPGHRPGVCHLQGRCQAHLTIISNSVRVERTLMMGTFGLPELVLVVAESRCCFLVYAC